MNQFEEARLRNEKRLAAIARSKSNKPEVPEKTEGPKITTLAPKVKPMVLLVSGPVEMTLEVDYAGTLISSQINEKYIRDLFVKCLKPIGRVR